MSVKNEQTSELQNGCVTLGQFLLQFLDRLHFCSQHILKLQDANHGLYIQHKINNIATSDLVATFELKLNLRRDGGWAVIRWSNECEGVNKISVTNAASRNCSISKCVMV